MSHFGGPNPVDPANSDVTQWKELIARLKDALIAAFDISVSEMEESVRGLDSKRGSLAWNFGEYFAAKVLSLLVSISLLAKVDAYFELQADLANRFASISLFEDCLLQYEELDAAFFQRLRGTPCISNVISSLAAVR